MVVWTPDVWAPVWRALLAKAPTVQAGEAPAWYAMLRRWQPDAVTAAIEGLPARPDDPYERLLDLLAPPPPDTAPALADAVAYAGWRDTVRTGQPEGEAGASPDWHPAIVEAAAAVGHGWLLNVDPAGQAAQRRWAHVYEAVARAHERRRRTG
ncbi:MAG: hypothetical protein M3N32_07795 [Actinomycetota bacterium]|nr:hypothetical protein [Actinomycetota bacterium]